MVVVLMRSAPAGPVRARSNRTCQTVTWVGVGRTAGASTAGLAWYLGAGERIDAARLQAYPAGSFVVIPAGVAHVVATKDGLRHGDSYAGRPTQEWRDLDSAAGVPG